MIRIRILAAFAIVLGAQPAPTAAAGLRAEPCPPSFEAFLARFRADTSFQSAHTARELIVSRVVDAEPEPKTVAERQHRETVRFPVMPDVPTARREGLVASVQGAGGDRPVVVLHRPDTDYQMRFTFQRRGCWQLVRKDDESL